jgi:hypothetical protein
MVKADADQRAGTRGGLGDGVQFRGAAGSGLFEQHVFAGRGGSAGDLRQHVVGGRGDHDVDIGRGRRFPPIGEDSSAAG